MFSVSSGMNKKKPLHVNNIRCRFDRSKKQAVFVRESHLEDLQLSNRMLKKNGSPDLIGLNFIYWGCSKNIGHDETMKRSAKREGQNLRRYGNSNAGDAF